MRSTMLPLFDYNSLFYQYSRRYYECDGRRVAEPQLHFFEIPLVSLVFPSFPTHLSRIKYLCLLGQFFFARSVAHPVRFVVHGTHDNVRTRARRVKPTPMTGNAQKSEGFLPAFNLALFFFLLCCLVKSFLPCLFSIFFLCLSAF